MIHQKIIKFNMGKRDTWTGVRNDGEGILGRCLGERGRVGKERGMRGCGSDGLQLFLGMLFLN